MEVLELLDRLHEEIETSAPFLFGGRCIINKEEILELIQDIEIKFPEDLKQAKWIKEERERILEEAKLEAEDIIKSANEQLISMINENEITKKAMEKASSIMEKTHKSAKEIQVSSYQYSDNMLERVQQSISNSIRELESISRTIDENRKELK